MKKYIKIASTKRGKGFITHEDQENNGLSFKLFGYEKEILAVVSGEKLDIDNWSTRVGGTEVDSSIANKLASDSLSEYKIERIKQLDYEKTNLLNRIAEVV